MRAAGTIMRCVLATLASSCVGTIDDSAPFTRGSGSTSVARDAGESPAPEEDEAPDVGSEPLDASSRDAHAPEAAIRDSAPAIPMDSAAWSPSDAAPVAEASAPDAASDANDARDAGDAGSCDFRGLMMRKCGSSGCHGALAVSSGLDLTSDNLATRLAGKKASLSCSSYLLIDPERPEESALYLKVTAQACGSRMPLGGTLTEGEQQCILQWISGL